MNGNCCSYGPKSGRCGTNCATSPTESSFSRATDMIFENPLTLHLVETLNDRDMKSLYSIGEFSQVTGLSVKTLRFYHEKGILIPSSVDETTGYRFYDASKVDKARVIMRLRHMEFSIEDIANVLGECSDEADILNYLER